MAVFDIINVVEITYRKIWEERLYLAKMAAFPFLVNLACFTLLMTYAKDESDWMRSIILLPAFFLQGWLLTHWARTIMTGGAHRWPFRFSGNQKKDMMEIAARSRGIMAGTIMYTLINFLIHGYLAFLTPYIPQEITPQASEDPRLAVVGLVMMVSSVLLFRFIWLYIPLSVNYPLGDVLKKLQPMSLTFRLIGLWLICIVPAMLALMLLGETVSSFTQEGEANAMARTVFLVFQLMIDLIKDLICTAGIAVAFLFIMKDKTP